MLDPEITGLRWEYSVEDGRRVGGGWQKIQDSGERKGFSPAD